MKSIMNEPLMSLYADVRTLSLYLELLFGGKSWEMRN